MAFISLMDVEENTYYGGCKTSHGTPLPLAEVDPKRSRFPCCIVWTPLPVVSWLAPFLGHVGICQEDGAVLDFSGANIVNIDDFSYGKVARYLQLDRDKCCFPTNLATHTCKASYQHSEYGTGFSWDDALQSGMRHYQHKCYNLFTCNSYSFVAHCLNRLAYGNSFDWNVVNVAALVLKEAIWVDRMAVIRSFFPFFAAMCIGIYMVGWPFVAGMAAFLLFLLSWFIGGVYCAKGLIR